MSRGHRPGTRYGRVGRKREPGRPWWVTTHPQFIPGGPGDLQVSIRISLSLSHLQLYEIKIPFAPDIEAPTLYCHSRVCPVNIHATCMWPMCPPKMDHIFENSTPLLYSSPMHNYPLELPFYHLRMHVFQCSTSVTFHFRARCLPLARCRAKTPVDTGKSR